MHRSRSCLLLGLLLVAQPGFAQAPQDKLSSTLGHLEDSKAREAQLKEELTRASQALDGMRAKATTLADSLQQSERRTTEAEREYNRVNGRLSQKEQEFAQRQREYTRTLTSLLRMQRMPPTALFGQPETMHTLIDTSRALETTNEALAGRAAQLKRDLSQLQSLRRDAAGRKTRLTREQQALDAQQKDLAGDLRERQRLQAKLQRDHAAARAQVNQLSRESASLQELIGKLEKVRTTPQFASRDRQSPPPSASINGARGGLKLPVVGTLEHQFGDRKNANETYRGLVLKARPGATVVAPYPGEVVFTGPFMDYGPMVLMKHGDGFISLMAGLGHISVGLNQRVGKGEPVGSMGAGTTRLYIELRDHSKPIDPAQWFANVPMRTASR